MIRLLNKIAVAMVLVLAILSISFSLLIALADYWGDDFLNVIESHMGGHLEISASHVTSDAYDVVVILDDVILRFPDKAPQNFKQIVVQIDTWKTLLRQEPVVSQIVMSGAHWHVVTDEHGNLSVPTLENQGRGFMQKANQNVFRLIMDDTKVTWRTPKQTYEFEHAILMFSFDGQRIKNLYDIPLPHGGRLHSVADMIGSSMNPRTWKGRVYAKVSHIDLQSWGDMLPFIGKHRGRLSASLDMHWEQGEFDNIAGDITLREYATDATDVMGALSEEQFALNAFATWRRGQDESIMMLRNLNLTSALFNWQDADLDIWFEQDEQALFSLTVPTARAMRVGEFDLTGSTGQVDIAGRIALSMDERQPDWRHIRNLRAQVDSPKVNLTYENNHFNWNDMHIMGDLHADDSGYSLNIANLNARQGSATYHSTATFIVENDVGMADIELSVMATPMTSLMAMVRLFDESQARELTPYENSTLQNMYAVWLSSFPQKEDDPAYLNASGMIENVTFALSETDNNGKVTDIHADFLLENDNLSATIHNATMSALDIRSARYVSIHDARQHVTATLAGALRDFIQYAKEDNGLALNADIAGQGVAQITASFSREDELDIMNGVLHVSNAMIRPADSSLVFSGVTGDIQLSADAMAGTLDGDMNGISVQSHFSETKGAWSVALMGDLDPIAFATKYHLADETLLSLLKNYGGGKARWQGEWFISSAGVLERMRFSSNLNGMSITMPVPLKKAEEESRPLVLNIRDKKYEWVYGSGDDQIWGGFINGDTLAGYIHFGSRQPTFSPQKFSISGNLANTVDIGEWKRWLSANASLREKIADLNKLDPTTEQNQATDKRRLKIFEARVRLAGLLIGQQLIQTPDIRVHIDELGWVINFASEPIHGILLKQQDEWLLNADRILWEAGDEEMEVIDPGDLPLIRVKVKDMRWGDKQIYKLTGVLKPISNGISIMNAQFSLSKGAADVDGTWRYENQRHESSFSFEVYGDDYGSLLKDIKLPGGMEKGRGDIQGYFNWPAEPWNAELKELAGNLQIDLKDGTMKQSQAGLERVVGLFNVSALVRRLRMDFDDVFDEDLSFDSLTGNFLLNDQNIKVRELTIDNLNTRVKIVGDANIARRDYDQEMEVVVKINEGLPLVGGLLGGPLAAIGLYVIDKATDLTKIVDKIATLKYKITGSWDDPEIEFIAPRGVKSSDFESLVKPLKEGIQKVVPKKKK